MAKKANNLERANLNDLGFGSVITFSYQAKTPGDRDRPRYDSAPMLILLDVVRKSNDVYILALNSNYLQRKQEREILLLTSQAGETVPLPLFDAAIHQYNLKRITSPIYKVKDAVVDKVVMESVAQWRRIRVT